MNVQISLSDDEVQVTVVRDGGKLRCPKCGKTGPVISILEYLQQIPALFGQQFRQTPVGYDQRTRRWRHLDTCQLKTLLVADVPRVQCAEHGVVTVSVPWAEPGSGFTALFEALVINWLKAASTSAVSERLRLSWNAVDGIMQRAVQRGLSRRAALSPRHLSVDETSYRNRHPIMVMITSRW